jgi:hypothetical protein
MTIRITRKRSRLHRLSEVFYWPREKLAGTSMVMLTLNDCVGASCRPYYRDYPSVEKRLCLTLTPGWFVLGRLELESYRLHQDQRKPVE